MSRQFRLWLLLAGLAGTSALLAWGFALLPPFGEHPPFLGDLLNQVGVSETNATNMVSAVNFDYRGADTMVEEFILFAAVAGVSLLLREQREEREERPQDAAQGRAPPGTPDTVVVISIMLAGASLLIGAYILATGALTAGGGFQVGVMFSTSLLILYVAGRYEMFERMTSIDAMEQIEAVTAGLYALIGVGGLIASGAFLVNFLPHGTTGNIVSSGTIVVLNVIVGVEVGTGFIIIIDQFLEQALLIRQRSVR